MKSLAERVSFARRRAGLTQAQLAKRAGVTRAGAGQWETGVTQSLSADVAIKVASALGVRIEWLVYGSGPLEEGPAALSKVPLVSWVAAGQWCQSEEPMPLDYQEKQVLTTRFASTKAYALRVRGDSMEPAIRDGAIVIVDPEVAADPGRVVIARLGEETTMKRLRIDGTTPYLVADNPAYPAMMLNDGCICGTVIQVVIDDV